MLKLIPFLFVILAGCKSVPVRHVAESPSIAVSQDGAITMKGDTPTPGKADTAKTTQRMPIPAGSLVVFNEKMGTAEVRMSKDSEIAVNRTETVVTGAVAFTPDKAPTIGEEKQAQANYWTTIGLYACVVLGGGAAIFGLVRGWNLVMYGGVAVACSGLFGLFVQRHPLLLLFIGIGVAAKVIGPVLWHTKLKHLKDDNVSQ